MSFNYYLSIAAILKDEAPYIEEWIEYHLLVGVEHFYLYDNESTDNLQKVLQPYINRGIVVYESWAGQAQQVSVYNDAVLKCKAETRWLAIIDADEFIVPLQDENIPQFLQSYEQYPAVVLNWFIFDCAGHINQPSGLVIENYTRGNRGTHIKSIVNPRKVAHANIHGHVYFNQELAVTENFMTVSGDFVQYDFVKRIQLNHYWTKSYAEFKAKVERGVADHNPNYILEKECYIFPAAEYNYAILKYLPKLKRALGYKFPQLSFLKWIYKIPFNYCRQWLSLVFARPQTVIARYLSESLIIKNSKYFKARWYRKKYLTQANDLSNFTLAEHYYRIGWKLGYNPSPKFSTNKYLSLYQDVHKAGMNPLIHYEKFGRNEKRQIFRS
ncbi:MAG: glycosyltransferase family 92 protein [Deltaproteobacteria bacterium]|jgi:hypothetical protein|nr:glycosyltransferase family 92 protein [Deltaproteobacteria bacterium]